jgi:transcriptional regulator with XRE-family HTH domain
MPAKPRLIPDAEAQRLAQLGERLRLARLRRKLSADAVAAQAHITRVTLLKLEAGDPGVTLGTLAKVLGVLWLGEDIEPIAVDDARVNAATDARLPVRRAPAKIKVQRYPQLSSVAWHFADRDGEVTPQEALALYERNWRHIEPEKFLPIELALVKHLTDTVGKGVLLV